MQNRAENSSLIYFIGLFEGIVNFVTILKCYKHIEIFVACFVDDSVISSLNDHDLFSGLAFTFWDFLL